MSHRLLISFDLDNTLWDVDPALVRAEHAMEKWFDELQLHTNRD